MTQKRQLAFQLARLPGFVSADTTSVVFEVRWLRGARLPALPEEVDGWRVKLVIVDAA